MGSASASAVFMSVTRTTAPPESRREAAACPLRASPTTT
jgi:hypothetical protein